MSKINFKTLLNTRFKDISKLKSAGLYEKAIKISKHIGKNRRLRLFK